MKIVVLVKYVPDAAANRSFAADDTTDRAGVDGVLSELDEYAVEQALRIAEALPDSEITYLTMGPEAAGTALRKALSMGGDAAVHVVDDAIHGSDALATSAVLAAALRTLEHDLIVAGMASTDAGMSVVPAMLSERLGLPAATLAGKIESVNDHHAVIRRDGDVASETIEVDLPAIISVTDQTGEARYPSFKGIMAAKKKPVTTLTLSDLGISPEEVGLSAAWTVVQTVTKRPARQVGVKVADDGTGATQLADYLVGQKLL